MKTQLLSRFTGIGIERQIFFATTVILLVMAVVAAIPFTLDQQVEMAFGALAGVSAREHTYEALLDTLDAVDHNRRAYLLSGSEFFLQPYGAALAALSPLRARLDAVVRSGDEMESVRTIDHDIERVLEDAARRPLASSVGAMPAARFDPRMAELKRRIAVQAGQAAQERRRWHDRVTHASRLARDGVIVAALLNAAILVVVMRGAGQALRARATARRRMRDALRALRRVAGAAEARSGLLHLLQSASSLHEAAPALGGFLRQVYPHSSGAVYLRRATTDQLDQHAAWGAAHWPAALPRSAVEGARLDRDAAPAASRWLPLMAQGQLLGAIVLVDATARAGAGAAPNESIASLAEQVALALANIDLRERLRQQSFVDPLTQLYNRRFLDAAFERELERARRDMTPLSLMLIDLDHFKAVNDDHGHEAGDAVLATVGALLRATVRGADVACRYGGEEMLVVLPGCCHEDALERAEQLRAGIADLVLTSSAGRGIRTSASFGVSSYPEHGASLAGLAAAADAALYAAKHDGRNRVASATTTVALAREPDAEDRRACAEHREGRPSRPAEPGASCPCIVETT